MMVNANQIETPSRERIKRGKSAYTEERSSDISETHCIFRGFLRIARGGVCRCVNRMAIQVSFYIALLVSTSSFRLEDMRSDLFRNVRYSGRIWMLIRCMKANVILLYYKNDVLSIYSLGNL